MWSWSHKDGPTRPPQARLGHTVMVAHLSPCLTLCLMARPLTSRSLPLAFFVRGWSHPVYSSDSVRMPAAPPFLIRSYTRLVYRKPDGNYEFFVRLTARPGWATDGSRIGMEERTGGMAGSMSGAAKRMLGPPPRSHHRHQRPLTIRLLALVTAACCPLR